MNKVEIKSEQSSLSTIEINKEIFYKISNVDEMRPFFMSIVSNSNHWMFISSNGGISAGRTNAEYALFPYYTDDKITDYAEFTGSKTILHIKRENISLLWEPFSLRNEGMYSIERNLYKSTLGNSIIFEEINNDLLLRFTYQWNSSDKYGFVKTSSIENLDNKPQNIKILDGLQNIMPACVGSDLQNGLSNLVDAYKRAELLVETGIGIFALSSIIVDRAEPSESLYANTVWSTGLENPIYLLSTKQFDDFRKGLTIEQEFDVKGERGAYGVYSSIHLESKQTKQWYFIANVHQDQSSIIALSAEIHNNKSIEDQIKCDINNGSLALRRITMSADGLQISGDSLTDSRHYANVLFNIMRGGIFYNQYIIDREDFCSYVQKANSQVYTELYSVLESLPAQSNLFELHQCVRNAQSVNFERIALEYLPLTFSRRHGDPSRPWNKFSINTKKSDGSLMLDYQGNWRDIFQNWEALVHSYPYFIEGIIRKFLNASTFDGYNPYRVVKDGFDWETIEAHNPWSYIGYWGDHQIIYLTKLLEFADQIQPDLLHSLLKKNSFVYAHIPYRIKSYNDILVNPKNTIDFMHDEDANIRALISHIGSDGALLYDANGELCQVNFIEKILATTLARLTNFVPDGGIWMNTQRPEWNDANNALVGNGMSMVTLYYLRRFIKRIVDLLQRHKGSMVELSIELHDCFQSIKTVLKDHIHLVKDVLSDSQRKLIMDHLGNTGSDYRNYVYNKSFSGKKIEISIDSVLELCEYTAFYIDSSIEKNKREDGLYHSYNLLSLHDTNASVSHLQKMLEGQVAALSSGYISPEECSSLLGIMRKSSLYRDDQESYMLYPNKTLPGFLSKNCIPTQLVENSPLLTRLIKDGNDTIIVKDIHGGFHFNASFRNAEEVNLGLTSLDATYQSMVNEERMNILTIYEEVFHHKEFTGRSGTFFGYEGLGSIYWHMVSKLRYAVQEIYLKSLEVNHDSTIIKSILDHYNAITAGLGIHKSPKHYGAFPTDPYSHTPLGKGAQQPGMTGQVKEDIMCRMRELGVQFKSGRIVFCPAMLRTSDFVKNETNISFEDVLGRMIPIDIPNDTLFFTVCQVPILYTIAEKDQCFIYRSNGSVESSSELALTVEDSKNIFLRNGVIESIHIFITTSMLQ